MADIDVVAMAGPSSVANTLPDTQTQALPNETPAATTTTEQLVTLVLANAAH